MAREPMREGKPHYGDNEYAGNGILKCAACGEPLRDHRIGPCPSLGGDRIYVGRPTRRENTTDPNKARLNPIKQKE